MVLNGVAELAGSQAREICEVREARGSSIPIPPTFACAQSRFFVVNNSSGTLGVLDSGQEHFMVTCCH